MPRKTILQEDVLISLVCIDRIGRGVDIQSETEELLTEPGINSPEGCSHHIKRVHCFNSQVFLLELDMVF